MKEKKLVIIAGPTAVGKTECSISLAKRINGEIISADSMQVYRYMDIGTAKITEKEKQGVVHYLIDSLLPSEEFHVARFQQMAKDAIRQIEQKGKIPIIVGGTGFYIQSVLYDIDFTENPQDHTIRSELEKIAQTEGAHFLHLKLQEIDPVSAENIHENNVKRVIRAIEFYQQTGMRISEHNEIEKQKESPYNAAFFVLNDDREKLYKKIDQRIDLMLQKGLVQEVKYLQKLGYKRSDVAMQGLGYKEILDYLNGDCTLEEAVYILKRDTRHFAKRQITWFKREPDAIWIDKGNFGYDNDKMLAFMMKELNARKIINE